jgi:short-subunit dehydrogenase
VSTRKILVLGATSSIAQEVERLLAKDGSELLVVARSGERLAALAADLAARGARNVQTFAADLEDIRRHDEILAWARDSCPDFDTVLLAYGTMFDEKDCEGSVEPTVRQLYNSFVSAAAFLTVLANHFEQKRCGCIAVITSVAGERGRRSNYVYGSAKGGLSLFVQGLRSRLYPSGVRVITIKPGPVKTRMTDHISNRRVFADVGQVAGDIYRALRKGKPEVLYTPWHWRYIMFVIRMIPERFFKRLAF